MSKYSESHAYKHRVAESFFINQKARSLKVINRGFPKAVLPLVRRWALILGGRLYGANN